MPLTSDGIVSLDVAYELDDAPRWERFFLVTGPQPFSVESISVAARSAALATADAPDSLDLPASLEQVALTLVKVDGPSRPEK